MRLAAGAYLTDERDLFRCVSTAPPDDPAATALLENCSTLELVVLPLRDLTAGTVRIVQPSADGAGRDSEGIRQPAVGGTGLEPVTSCL